MSLRFILGNPGTGKTTLCLQEINERLNSNTPLCYLVPEQFSLQSEKLLLSQRSAATQVQVLSFNRLAYRLFAMFGGVPGKLADDLGKQMLLRKVLFEVEDKLTYYKSAVNKHGFVDTLAQTITEMNQYCVQASDLQYRAQDTSAFSAKLSDIAVISAAYRQLVKGRYLLTDDMLDLLCSTLEEMRDCPLLDGGFVWVDGFSGFTPQERQVLKHIMKRAQMVSVTLTTAPDPLLTPPTITKDKLTQLANDARITIEKDVVLEKNHRNSPGIAAFVQNFTMLQGCKPAQPTSDIEIIAAPDRYAAVNTAAAYVTQLVREQGYCFRDIAIVCGDRTHYEKILQTTFDRLNIPLFVDTEIDILSHPLTEMIRSALDIVLYNWSYESVFRFLKTRMTNLSLDAIDVLENYVLEHGIASYRWRYAFKNPQAEAARVQLLAALSAFAKPRANDTVQNHCRRVFDMLYALNVPDNLHRLYETHMRNGDHATARLHKQIWPAICGIFDKLVEMLGDENISLKTFAATLDAGFNQVGLGRVPPVVDQVVLGDIGRSRYPQIKAMIVLGANENALPPPPTPSGLLTNNERQLLRNTGIELAAETMHRLTESHYSLYCALSQPSHKLVLVYSESETSGKPLRPSPIITRMQEIFPGLRAKTAPAISEYGTVANPTSANDQTLSQESTSRLYGEVITTAASRLESYARCPFAYFMTYNLGAQPRKRFQVLSADLGTLFHDILAQFARQEWQGKTPREITRTEIDHHVDNILAALTAGRDIFHDTARNRHMLNKMRRVAAASIWALGQHLKMGSYTPAFAEYEVHTSEGIALPSGKTLHLKGYVDRVDTLEVDGQEYVKIIDYKSGNVKFDMREVRKGIQLQLMIYMNILTAKRGAKPGGIFYFPIDDPVLSTDILLDDKLREAGILKQFKMSGITVANDDVMAGLDKTLAPGVSSNIAPMGLLKDGKKSAATAALDLGDFIALGNEVNEKIKELGTRMTCGDIAAVPYVNGQKSPCNYCGFGAVCGR